jgi:hypothetical protein
MRRIIFLDIDGVVLPLSQPARCRYENFAPADIPLPLQRLTTFLDDYPSVELVLSSSWRVDYGLERARDLLPLRHRKKLIGATPMINNGRDRGEECLLWLADRKERCLFAALDDCRQLFASNINWLVLVDARAGIVDKTILELTRVLELKR